MLFINGHLYKLTQQGDITELGTCDYLGMLIK
jgi:hypothetical protein